MDGGVLDELLMCFLPKHLGLFPCIEQYKVVNTLK